MLYELFRINNKEIIRMRNIKMINEQSVKSKMVSVIKETLEICRVGEYVSNSGIVVDIKEQLESAKENTQLFKSDFSDRFLELDLLRMDREMIIEVTKESTVECGFRLVEENIEEYDSPYIENLNILALNFASGVSVGGGVLMGAVAQEEDLCRSSGLFSCLELDGVREYYENNRKNLVKVPYYPESKSGVYTDDMIYSGGVPFFRGKDLELLDTVYYMSVITSCAPCVKDLDMGNFELREYVNKKFEIRMRKMLSLAAYMGHRELILGAWGCGAFGNDARDVALMFKKVLGSGEMEGLFDKVVFAIYAKDETDLNYGVFKEVFDGV